MSNQMATTNELVCSYCSARFVSKYSCKRHMDNNCKSKPSVSNKTYDDYCNYIFVVQTKDPLSDETVTNIRAAIDVAMKQ